MKKMLVVFAVCFAVFNAEGAVDWDIYDDASIQDGDVYLAVNIYDNPPEQTVVNMTGGDISFCNIFDSAQLNCSGCEISFLDTYNNSVVSVNANAGLDLIDMYDSSTVFLHNGAENVSNIRIYNDSLLHIYGYSLKIEPLWVEGYSVDDEWFTINFRNSFTPKDHIILHEVPEPATVLLLVSASGVLYNRRRS
ncbi:PEP-CTERM sorting domain-containing protein [Sedimentisphaera salicampi]|uniref:PEP-CTERM sorting domain-containing protein n=1 Tax=Sedimentisphaera salicampi TaxID=1941349 RepID=UPI000B9A7F96|nr:PEP-CTERM sorting domain-containing protein [Sedimentisphaera salicampi]OXU16214.1 hypothetical protein SMSP1_00058 [Sedimentisphaera salicampi]